ncbi:GNAT family N-acetyltransferase [Noviherbaspirillum cavernae]|nr:GNAT family N-acetyltransferase [Noviherbaspirillum cavernae]
MDAQQINISVYENLVPDFAEAELENLYGNIYSSLAQLRACGNLEGINTYAVRDGDRPVCILLFRRRKTKLQVVNEGMAIGEKEMRRFAEHMFATCSSLNLISFHAIATDMRRLPFPHQRYNCLEDIVLALPRTPQAYLASMGKSTRSYINRYMNKIRRELPTLRFQVHVNEEVSEQQLHDVIQLNKYRMAEKNKVWSIDGSERIVRLARSRGLTGIMEINGRVCAGVVNFRAGDNYFLELLSHDPAYNDYRLGTLCCYLTICECITRGGREYHFLWGQNEYKYRLLGVQRDLDHVAIYRSRAHMLLHADTALNNTVKSAVRRTKVWRHHAQHGGRHDAASRLALNILNRISTIKHHADGLLARQKQG